MFKEDCGKKRTVNSFLTNFISCEVFPNTKYWQRCLWWVGCLQAMQRKCSKMESTDGPKKHLSIPGWPSIRSSTPVNSSTKCSDKYKTLVQREETELKCRQASHALAEKQQQQKTLHIHLNGLQHSCGFALVWNIHKAALLLLRILVKKKHGSRGQLNKQKTTTTTKPWTNQTMGGTGLKFESWKVEINSKYIPTTHSYCFLKEIWFLKSGSSLKSPPMPPKKKTKQNQNP